MGLTALLLQHARAAARFDANGELVLMDDQDRTLWNKALISEGLALIDKAMRHRRSGPYQIQAAIAALHARAARPEDTDWAEIDLLYSVLESMTPSPVVTLNRAVAYAKLRGPEAALQGSNAACCRLLPLLRCPGGLLMQLGRDEEAREAFGRAIALAPTPLPRQRISACISTGCRRRLRWRPARWRRRRVDCSSSAAFARHGRAGARPNAGLAVRRCGAPRQERSARVRAPGS